MMTMNQSNQLVVLIPASSELIHMWESVEYTDSPYIRILSIKNKEVKTSDQIVIHISKWLMQEQKNIHIILIDTSFTFYISGILIKLLTTKKLRQYRFTHCQNPALDPIDVVLPKLAVTYNKYFPNSTGLDILTEHIVKLIERVYG